MKKYTALRSKELAEAIKQRDNLCEEAVKHIDTCFSLSLFEWRNLTDKQIETLKANNNHADNWDNVLVTNTFDECIVRNSTFHGMVRIADLEYKTVEINGLIYTTGIYGCNIHSCDIGSNVVLNNIGRLENYVVGNESVICNVFEISTTSGATFGCGIKSNGTIDGIKAMNEGGLRQFIPFADILPADAYLMCKYIGNKSLKDSLIKITRNSYCPLPTFGTINEHSLIFNTNSITNTLIGTCCRIENATKIANSTIKSSCDEPTCIGEGSIIKDTIVGKGCNVLENSIVQKDVLGTNVTIEHGARVINSMVSDNSTIACCEVQNSMVFPSHQQHHNNSFLIASTILGQSNIAAGATIGSNHNSRTNEGEIFAGRGFWPGLCTSFKHPSKFASFVLVAKGDYQHELNIPLPFSLVNNNLHANELEIMPAYLWMYNMYALERNNYKFQHRDKRVEKLQNIEQQVFAPDTIEEIIRAMELLELWTGKAWTTRESKSLLPDETRKKGREILTNNNIERLDVFADRVENSRRKVRIIKPREAYRAYYEMLMYYAAKNILKYIGQNTEVLPNLDNLATGGTREKKWINLGGQLVTETDFQEICEDIVSGELSTWGEIHNRYDELWDEYPFKKTQHSYAVICHLKGGDYLSQDSWNQVFKEFFQIQEKIYSRVRASRQKDFDNPYHQMTYNSFDEMNANLGTIDTDPLINLVQLQTSDYKEILVKLKILSNQ
ncbi:MAG: DUF4954 family protein [Bacteroidales bacterium]|nr:DUF4954 family protein [Bacteroidales bacterium]